MPATSWRELRAELVDATDEPKIAEHRDRMLAEVRAHRLAEARQRRHLTQQAIAQSMGISQSRVSAIERSGVDRVELSTLAAYVEALGGRLQVVADFGDEKLVLG